MPGSIEQNALYNHLVNSIFFPTALTRLTFLRQSTYSRSMKSRMLGVLFLTAASAAFAAIPSPQESFGFPVGSDRKLADWQQLVDYYQQLAKNSDRVRFADLGKTTEGRPFVLLTISAPANISESNASSPTRAAPRQSKPKRSLPAERQSSSSPAIFTRPKSPARKPPRNLPGRWLQKNLRKLIAS
jgi:hypothetical protein